MHIIYNVKQVSVLHVMKYIHIVVLQVMTTSACHQHVHVQYMHTVCTCRHMTWKLMDHTVWYEEGKDKPNSLRDMVCYH